ncbi:MAG: lipopolysaccharide heptosyltransferase I [Syntrophobacterales bacterium]|nr:lipopolysaccharide heptosyltransferase I [Syntrophobacterales bacterium]
MRHGTPRLLLIKLSSFGDVIHALPTLEALREAYPRAVITWLVEEVFAPLLSGHPALDRVWVVPRVRPGRPGAFRDVHRLLTMARQLRQERFDAVLDLQGLLKSALWTALAPSPRKVGYDGTRELSYLPLTERLPPYDPEAHAVRRYLEVARHLGATPGEPRFRLGHLVQEPRGLGEKGGPLVVLHPGARWPSKLWPVEHWAALAAALGHEGFRVALTGSDADRGLTQAIASRVGDEVLDLAGRTDLGELAWVLQRARLMVSVDTGPMHLAAALGTPVVALFGPTAPWRTGPFGPGHEVVRLGLPCSPCLKRRCPEPRCLAELPVARVLLGVRKLLSPLPGT